MIMVPLSGRAQNLVQNSSFESDFSGWIWSLNGGAAGTRAIDSTQHHWEKKSVQFSYSGSYQSGKYARLAQSIGGLTVGKSYYVYFYCKGTAVGVRGQFAAGASWQYRQAIPSGSYNWTRVGFSFIADATSVPVMLLVQDATTSLWADDIYVLENPLKDVTTLGIANNGTIDVTNALGTALATNRVLYFPAGTYLLTAGIELPSNTILWGEGANTIIKIQNAEAVIAFVANGSDSGGYKQNIEISGLRFTGLSSQRGIQLKKAVDVLVRHCLVEGPALIKTSTHKATYASVTSENDLCRNIRVAFNTLDASSGGPSGGEGINLCYTSDAEVHDNIISNYSNGIMWWGGDSNLNANGALNNPRWARRIRIHDNTVTSSGQGGIWGSMGINITVENNVIAGAGDVGLDFEGCVDSTARYNQVSNGVNGCMSTFFAVSNVVFEYNTVVSENASWQLFKLYNSTSNPVYVQGLVLRNNEFICTSGVGRISDSSGPGSIAIQDNLLTNVRIDISHNATGFNVAAPTITGNTLDFESGRPATVAINIFFWTGTPVVQNNTVNYMGVDPATTTGIKLRRNTTSSRTATIIGNVILGCRDAEVDVYDSAAGFTATINNNTLEFGRIEVGKAGYLIVNASGNKKPDGLTFPLTWMP